MSIEEHNQRTAKSTTERLSQPLEKGFAKIADPFKDFIENQTAASAILLGATVISILIANSPYSHSFEVFVNTKMGFVYSDITYQKSIHAWINEGLMALFFFFIGLEIKREMLVGELSQLSRTIPIIVAAIGGMLLPAGLYVAVNLSSETMHGWGIPMATDTAFVIGILALLRKHVPSSLVIFITALAIIDDIGAILVIALFYSDEISAVLLGYAAMLIIILFFFNLIGIRRPTPYLFVGGLLWLTMLESGIHATVAGILAAMVVPARAKHNPNWFVDRASKLLRSFERREQRKVDSESILADPEQHEIVEQIQEVANKASTPLQRWEHALERPVALLVLPIFALANAGVTLSTDTFSQRLFEPLALGIMLGLLLGKCLGITLGTWAVLKLGLGTLAEDINLGHIVGIGLLAGIGFTMSVFVAGLGFSSSPEHLITAKTGILFASLFAGCGGYIWLRFVAPKL